MPENATPETAPEEEQEEQVSPVNRLPKEEGQETKRKKTFVDSVGAKGGEGASTEVSPEQKKRIIEEHLAKNNIQKKRFSTWHNADEALRPKVGTAMKIGAIAALPPVALGIIGGDFVARNTVGRIPYLGALYNKPREGIMKIGEFTRNVISGTLTSPAGIFIDTPRDIIQTVKGVNKFEAHGWLDSAREHTVNAITKMGTLLFKSAKFMTEKSLELGQGLLKVLISTVKLPFSVSYQAANAAHKHIPLVKRIPSPLISIPLAAAGGLGIGYGVAAMFGMQGVYAAALGKLWVLIKGIPAAAGLAV